MKPPLVSYQKSIWGKVHVFWEGRKTLQNLHQLFVLCTASQIIGGDFVKFCGLLRIYELYKHFFKGYILTLSNQILYFSERTPFGQVKLGELPGWLLSSSKNPLDFPRMVARGWWRWRYELFQFEDLNIFVTQPTYCQFQTSIF